MRTRQEAIRFCLLLGGCYEDYPFRDPNWTVIRHNDSRKVFAWIFEREGNIWINVKSDPEWRNFWREAFDLVITDFSSEQEILEFDYFRRYCARG